MRVTSPYDILVDLLALAPQRRSGTAGAETTRAWITDQLTAAGLTASVERFEFTVANNQVAWGTLLNAWGTAVLTLAAPALNPWIGIGLLIALSAIDFWIAPALSKRVPKQGINVFAGIQRPWAEVVASSQPVLLISSHYDTAEAEPAWLRRLQANSDTFFSVAAVGLVLLALFFLTTGVWAWIPAAQALRLQLSVLWDSVLRWVVMVLGLPIIASTTLWELRRLLAQQLTNPGADDNASGVAVTLSLIETLKDISRESTLETAIAFFDAEEIGFRGSHHFVRTYASALRPETTTVLNVDCVGRDGSPAVVLGQGLLQRVRANPEVVELWHKACEINQMPTANLWLTFLTGGTDQAAWLKLGFSRALTVAHGRLQSKRVRSVLYRLLGIPVDSVDLDWAHLHSPGDSIASISPVALQASKDAIATFATLLSKNSREGA